MSNATATERLSEWLREQIFGKAQCGVCPSGKFGCLLTAQFRPSVHGWGDTLDAAIENALDRMEDAA